MFRSAYLPLLLAAWLVAQDAAISVAETKSSSRSIAEKDVRPTPAAVPVRVMPVAVEQEESLDETSKSEGTVDDATAAPKKVETPTAEAPPNDTPVPEPPVLESPPAADESAEEMSNDESTPLDSIDPPTLTEPVRRAAPRTVPPVVPPPPAPIQPPANRAAPAPLTQPNPPYVPTRPTPPPAANEEATDENDEDSSSDMPETVATPSANNYEKAQFRSDVHSFLHKCCLPGFYAGFEMTFLAPLDDPCPVVTLSDLVSGNTYVSDVDPGLGVGFRTWLGFQNPNAFGFRVSYWNLGSYLTTPAPVVPTMDKTSTLGAYYLNAQTLYFELLNSFCCGHGGYLDVSFGAAYARMERNSTALGYGQFGNDEAAVKLYGLATCADSIEGMGFTGSIGGRHRICCGCENIDELGGACTPGGFTFFWNLRGTVLWADSQVYGRTEAHAYTSKFGGSSAYTANSAFACSDGDTIGIGEMQLGVAYQRCLTCFPGFLTMRLALEGQYWGTAPISAVSDSTAYLIGGPPLFGGEANSQVNGGAGGLSLLGVTFGVCLSF